MMKCIDLSKSIALESLTLQFAWHTSRPPWATRRSELSYVDLLLSGIYSQSLHTLTFHFEFVQTEMNNPQWLKTLDLRFLDRLVQPDEFRAHLDGDDLERARVASTNLKRINIILDFPKPLGSRTSSQMLKFVRAQLPELDSRGMLHITHAS